MKKQITIRTAIYATLAAVGLASLLCGFVVGMTAHAETVPQDVIDDAPLSTSTVVFLIREAAERYGVNEARLYGTLKCESSVDGIPFDTNAIGDGGTSFGIAQIHLSAHPDVTRVQAMDGRWAIDWAAKEFSKGRAWQWTCWKIKYAK